MTEEQKPTAPSEEPTVMDRVEESKEEPDGAEEKVSAASDAVAHRGNALAEKRGELVTAGIISVIIVSVMVVLVAGIFQLASRVLVKCPQDLQVNDPAPILWEKVEASPLRGQPLGLTEKLLPQAGLKIAAPSADESEHEDTAEKPK